MIGSASTGADFRGLGGYLLYGRGEDGEERVGWTAVRNLPLDDPKLAGVMMDATAYQNVRVEKPVYHLSLNAPPGEHLSREQWEQVADRVLRDLGLEEHQALIVAHTDRPHEHVHLMVNRVHMETLRTWSNSFDFARIERSLRQIEREMGLREVPGHHHQLAGQEPPRRDFEQPTAGELREESRTGEESWASRTRFAVYNDFRDAESWGDLEARLAEQGLQLTKRGRGLVVTDGERQVKASRVHRGRSLPKLEKRFGVTFDAYRQQVKELHGAIREYEATESRRETLQLDQARLGREAERLREELQPFHVLARTQREVRLRLKAQLAGIYGKERMPEASRELDRLARRISYPKAAEVLRTKPTVLGKLPRGPDWARREALETVPRAALSVEELGRLRQEIAKALDREMKRFWISEGRPSEAPDSLTQARWRMEEAEKKLDKLLPTVFRAESLGQVSDTLKRTRDPTDTARLLDRDPRGFGRLLGRGWGPFANQERKDALARVPGLAAVVREHGEQRLLMIRLFLEMRNAKLGKVTDRLERTGRSLYQLPSQTRLLMAIARAAERVGIRALGQILPIPQEIGALKSAARGLGKALGMGSETARNPGPQLAQQAAVAGTRLATQAGLRVLSHLVPGPQQPVVQLALQTAASLVRTVTRELSR